MPIEAEQNIGEADSGGRPSGFVEGDSVLCRRCGYELRGLPVGGVCPECGGLIARSLQGNLLLFANPGFLRSLATGASMVVAAIILICLVPIIATLLRAAAGWTQDIIDGRYHFVIHASASLTTLCAGGLALVGWFALTARDPGFIGADRSTRARMITRGSTVFLAALFAIAAILFVLPRKITAAPMFLFRLHEALPWILATVIGVQVASSLAYLSHIADRVPDAKLRSDAKMIRRVTIALAVLMVLALCFEVATRRSSSLRMLIAGQNWIASILGVVVGVTMLGLAVTVIVRYADIIDRTRKHALRLARLSEFAAPDESGGQSMNTLGS